ncbi:S1/P1 Nuclease [Lacunisphaera limnophila]|uniref:S1/P1 Nuclease n=1 Tax=Lacunisphaera limnophila TaxID=1838286 RepID=A0A1D8AUY4_9BACT|nr:hypothetical protein [Lacunisphaera limnophila]AOS44675.1 S1/P1 Nuclease [Lacunisphaera limnophila]
MRHLRLLFALLPAAVLQGWDYHGHRTINQLALAALPADFPAFVQEPAHAERIAYLSGGPDRWRNVDPWLRQTGPSWNDHFLDVEQLPAAGLDPLTVPSLRYDFILAFAAGRAAHADRFPAIDPARNADGTALWPGFAPWAITEWTHKLRSAFAALKAFMEMGGTPEEIANARADAVQAMGLLGHYVGDCAQPLHTTDHYNGWAGPNPEGYTTWRGMHSWADGGLVAKAGITLDTLKPRVKAPTPLVLGPRPDGRDPLFVAVMDWFLRQHAQVEPLYQLEKAGKLSNAQEKADRTRQFPGPVDPAGRAFFEDRLLSGGDMLATVWVTAWQSAPVDTYLRSQLARRSGAKTTDTP